MIPNIIHLIFFGKEDSFPKLFFDCMQRIKDLHPLWDVRLYGEEDAQEILKKYLPQFIDAYNSFKFNIQKVDFFRIALVYIYGGFYMDLDILCLKSLDSLNEYKLILGEEKMISEEEQQRLSLKNRLRIANYMFGGIEGHLFLFLLMERMSKLSHHEITTQQELLDITGPGLVTDLYHECSDTLFPDITLLRNTTRKCLLPNHFEISCHFGDYAAHLHAGIWRTDFVE